MSRIKRHPEPVYFHPPLTRGVDHRALRVALPHQELNVTKMNLFRTYFNAQLERTALGDRAQRFPPLGI